MATKTAAISRKRKIKGPRYAWREGYPFRNLDADACAAELEAIAREQGVGKFQGLAGAIVFEWVRSHPDSELAKAYHFEDVQRAARHYWIQLSAQLIAACYELPMDVETPRPRRAWICVQVKPSEEEPVQRLYIKADTVMADPDLAESAKASCYALFKQAKSRFGDLISRSQAHEWVDQLWGEDDVSLEK